MESLRSGGVVLFPTETVYGFGCDAADAEACARIRELKGWTTDRPMLVLAADRRQASELGCWTDEARAMADRFWPGPLTLILDGGESPSVAVRVSPHPIATSLVRSLGRPVTSTSANRTGEPPPRTMQEAGWFGGRGPDVLVDGGEVGGRLGSTIVDCRGDLPSLVRAGDLPPHELHAFLGLDGHG